MNSIAKRVMVRVKQKIEIAQQQHDQTCARLDSEHTEKVELMEAELFATKEQMANDLVEGICGK